MAQRLPSPDQDQTDADLLRSISSGDAGAFTALYRRHQRRIYRFSRGMSGSHSLAEEAVQETFLALLQNNRGFDPTRGTLGSWLIGVVRHKILRLMEREPAHGAIEIEPAAAATTHSRDERMREVRRAVQSLPANYREVVVLCDLEEMDYEAAARALACPVGTVRSRLHRARQMLAARLAPAERPRAAQGRNAQENKG